MEGQRQDQTKEPAWWTEDHTSGWERVKEAFRRDWEQTKADLTSNGQDLDQQVGDTVKQAAGTESIPPPGRRNHSIDFEDIERAYRYGYGASQHYNPPSGGETSVATGWDPDLEEKLEEEWFEMGDQQSWMEIRPHVRRAWESSRKS